jgi:pyrroline-5-carboxylate reductase
VKIAFLGGGNMATALIGGLIAKGQDPRTISVIEMSPAARERLGAKFPVHLSTAPDAAAQGAEVLVLAIKPQDMKAALASFSGFSKEKLVVSVAAGIRLDALSRWLGGHRRIVRCMPNTPGLIGAGITGLYAPADVEKTEREKAETILRAVGEVVWVAEERLLDPVTAVSASGPAYVFWFIEQLAAAAVKLGIPKEDALRLAKQTVLGAARLALSSEKEPAELRKDVTSKGGTTEAALNVFEQEKLAERFFRAIEAASRRGEEMGREFGASEIGRKD